MFLDVISSESENGQIFLGYSVAFLADLFALARCEIRQEIVKTCITAVLPMKLLANPLQQPVLAVRLPF